MSLSSSENAPEFLPVAIYASMSCSLNSMSSGSHSVSSSRIETASSARPASIRSSA